MPSQASAAPAPALGPKVVFLGDSISAGAHLAADQAFPAHWLAQLPVARRSATPVLVPLLNAHLAAIEIANGAAERAKVALERGSRAFRPKPAPDTDPATQIAAADCLGQLAWIEAVGGSLTSALHRAADVLTARPADSTETGVIHNRAELPESVFAFPRQRKEPLTDADHVRNALARFDQVQGVSDADRDLAFANIKAAAAYYGVDVRENSWRDLMR